MKNRNLVETRKLKNNVPVFICRRKCTRSMQKNEINRFYLWAILPDLNCKKKRRHICRTNDVIGVVLHVSMTTDCLQTSFVEKSQAHISSNLDDQGVIGLLNGRLLCQKTVAISHYSPHVILIDSSTKITSLERSVSIVKLCGAKIRFKVHCFGTISQNSLIFGSP